MLLYLFSILKTQKVDIILKIFTKLGYFLNINSYLSVYFSLLRLRIRKLKKEKIYLSEY